MTAATLEALSDATPAEGEGYPLEVVHHVVAERYSTAAPEVLRWPAREVRRALARIAAEATYQRAVRIKGRTR